MGTTEVIVGKVGRAHGIRGDVFVEPRTDEPELRFAAGETLRAEGSTRRFTVTGCRWHAERLLVTFDELADRTAAEAVRGLVLVTDVDEHSRPDDPDEYYDRHLIGLRVLDAAGVEVGVVTAVLHPPAQDLLEVATAAGPRLVPFTKKLVPVVDLETGSCRLADVPGLIVDAEAEVADPR